MGEPALAAAAVGIDKEQAKLTAQRLQSQRMHDAARALNGTMYQPPAVAAAAAAAAEAAAVPAATEYWQPFPAAGMTDYAVLAAYDAEVARSG